MTMQRYITLLLAWSTKRQMWWCKKEKWGNERLDILIERLPLLDHNMTGISIIRGWLLSNIAEEYKKESLDHYSKVAWLPSLMFCSLLHYKQKHIYATVMGRFGFNSTIYRLYMGFILEERLYETHNFHSMDTELISNVY